jgi:hypothetical protein
VLELEQEKLRLWSQKSVQATALAQVKLLDHSLASALALGMRPEELARNPPVSLRKPPAVVLVPKDEEFVVSPGVPLQETQTPWDSPMLGATA